MPQCKWQAVSLFILSFVAHPTIIWQWQIQVKFCKLIASFQLSLINIINLTVIRLMLDDFNSAVIDLNDGNFESAIEKFNNCIQSKIKTMNSLKLRSQAYFYDSKFQSSVTSYQQLIKLYPNSELGYIGKALSLTVLGNLQEVQSLYDSAFRNNQNNWKVFLYYGYSLARMRQYDKSLQNLTQAITKNNLNDPISYIVRAQAFCHRKDFAASRNDIKYAKQAIKESENQKILYKFQIKQIQQILKQYDKVIQDLDGVKQKKLLSAEKAKQYQTQLTKNLSKAAFLNNINIFNEFAKKVHCSSANLKQNIVKSETSVDIITLQKQRSCECPTSCRLF